VASTRRLAAILAADIVGYSRLMGLDEAGTAQLVRDIVRAEERGGIAAKGIPREVPVFAVAGFVDEP
jgi:hypothetical protein